MFSCILLIFGLIFAFFDDCFVLLAPFGYWKDNFYLSKLSITVGYSFVDMNHFFVEKNDKKMVILKNLLTFFSFLLQVVFKIFFHNLDLSIFKIFT